jgi:hypothetical protein
MRTPRHGRTLACIALLAAALAGVYWRILFTSQYSILDSPDMVNMELPRLQFMASELRHLRVPLWDPYLWCGQPFLAQFTGAAYPLNWLIPPQRFVDGKVSYTLFHWTFWLIHLQGAAFAFWLCRDLGRSHAASMLAALVFTLGTFNGDTQWLQVLNGAVWAPLIWMFLLRAARGEKPVASAAFSGLGLGLAWLSGHHEAPLYLSTAAAACWLWLAATAVSDRLRTAALAAFSFLVAGLTGALQILPGAEYGRLAKRWAGWPEELAWHQPIPYSVHEHYSLTPAAPLGVFLTGLTEHVSPFLGCTALGLILAGIAILWRRHGELRLFACLALGALALAMASTTWFHGALYALLPVFGKASVPARALVVFGLAAAPLAAYGLDALRSHRDSPWTRRLAAASASAGALLLAAAMVLAWAEKTAPSRAAMLAAAAALLLAAATAGLRTGALPERTFAAAVMLLSLWEFGHGTSPKLANLLSKERTPLLQQLRAHADIANYLRSRPGPVRAAVNDANVPYNFGDWEGMETHGGFVAGVTANILEAGVHQPRIQDLLAVTHTVSKDETRPGQELVFTGASGIRVFRNPGAFPRARIVHAIEHAPDENRRRQLLENPEFDLLHRATMTAPPPAVSACEPAGEQAVITRHEAGAVDISVNLNCRAMVVLADTSYPGWQADVDRMPVPIHTVDGALRGVVVEGGGHSLSFRFRPSSVYWGAALSLAGIALAFAAAFWERRRPTSHA